MHWILANGGAAASWLPLEMTPLHPILVNFTAALVPTSFAAEVLGRALRKPSLTATAWWTLLLAALVTPLTAAAGWYWMRQMDMSDTAGRQMAVHQWLGVSLALLFIAVAVWRGLLFRGDRAPRLDYFAALLLLVVLLTLQGHLGGVMSFGQTDTATIDHPTSSRSDVAPAPLMHDIDTHETTTTPTTVPSSQATTDADGWADSIHLKGGRP